jgi:hypothetical protein
MKYELAKELKDAGFPGIVLCDCHEPSKVLDAPTLSELIEACGERFFSLQTSGKGGPGWYSIATGMVTAEGTTPEEAVARLWLALNQTEKVSE